MAASNCNDTVVWACEDQSIHTSATMFRFLHGVGLARMTQAPPLPSAEFVVSCTTQRFTDFGRVPGYCRSDLKSSVTKRSIWTLYFESATSDGNVHPIEYSRPQVLIMKPMSDLCWQCQQNSCPYQRRVQLLKTTTYSWGPRCNFSPPLPLTKIPANIRNIRVHYSFNYAQQVHGSWADIFSNASV